MVKLISYKDITLSSSRKKIEEMRKKYKIIEANFFSSSDTLLVDDLNPILLTPEKIKSESNFSSDVLSGAKLEKYKSKLNLNIKMDIPLSNIRFNEDVFSYLYNTNYDSDGEEEDVEQLKYDFQDGTIQQLNVRKRNSNDFDKGAARPTITFPIGFPLFDDSSNSKSFVVYEGQIAFAYYRNDISDVEKSQEFEILYQKSQLETLEKFKKNIKILEEKISSSAMRIKAKRNYKKAKDYLEKKLKILENKINNASKVEKLKHLSLKQLNENINKILEKGNSKTLEDYLESFNGEFYIFLYVGENSFITLKLKKIEDKNLKRKNSDVNVMASTSKK